MTRYETCAIITAWGDIMPLETNDIERLKEIFVTRQKCSTTTESINNKLNNDNKELALIKAQLATISWVAKTTLASGIGLLVTYIATNLL